MDAVEDRHVVLELIFLKYISDAFKEMHANLFAGEAEIGCIQCVLTEAELATVTN